MPSNCRDLGSSSDVELACRRSGMASSAARRWLALGTHAASVRSAPRWQGLQRPPETCGSAAWLHLWPTTLPRHRSSGAAARDGSGHPPEFRGGCAVVARWLRRAATREEPPAGRPRQQGRPSSTFWECWEATPRAAHWYSGEPLWRSAPRAKPPAGPRRRRVRGWAGGAAGRAARPSGSPRGRRSGPPLQRWLP